MESRMNGFRILEITITSAENLSGSNGRAIKNVHAVVRADQHSYAATMASSEGGPNPRWKEKLSLELPMHSAFITIQVYCKASLLLGAARVPVSDFVAPHSFLHCLSYRLRDANGQRNGIVNFSARVKNPPTSCFAAAGAITAIPAWNNCYA